MPSPPGPRSDSSSADVEDSTVPRLIESPTPTRHGAGFSQTPKHSRSRCGASSESCETSWSFDRPRRHAHSAGVNDQAKKVLSDAMALSESERENLAELLLTSLPRDGGASSGAWNHPFQMTRYRILPPAKEELRNASRWYEEQREGLDHALLDEFEE